MNTDEFKNKLQRARQCMAEKKYAEALPLYATLVKQFPQGAGEYGRAAADSGDFELAMGVWEKFLGQHRADALLLSRLADEFQTIGLHARARALLSTAAAIQPGNLDLQLKLAALLARTSSVDEAQEAVDRCLALNPGHERARYLSAHLGRRAGKYSEAEQQFRDLLAGAIRDPSTRYSCYSELAQILDRAGRFEEAMSTLEEGKKLARSAFNLEFQRVAFYKQHDNEVRQIVALPKNILRAWSAAFPERARNTIPPLAFLSGSARSGTTLLERILDAHPEVAAFDESPAFKAVRAQFDFSAGPLPAQRLNVLRSRYVKNLILDSPAPPIGKTLLDKSPSRTVWLPGLLRLFPDLRVLIALRDPRDIMISLYFQDHVRTNYLTFEQLAHHYAGVMDVWLAIRQWEDLVWLETRYEDTVADIAKEGARVTKFLGLEWKENQSCFYESNREKPVMSTNYGDVTQPIYKRAVGRWKAYEKYLIGIIPKLDPYLKEFGY